MSFVKEILDRMPQRPPRRVTFTCVTVSPLTGYLEGDTSTAVPARQVAGTAFTPGQTGLADWKSGSVPIAFKTT